MISGEPYENQPPETDVFIQSSDTLNYTQSIQTIYWDGRDPDGFVVGFYYTWAADPQPSDWEFTKERSKTFPLRITGTDTVYIFRVKAVDNLGAEDPTPAEQLIPIKNSPPSVSWTASSVLPDTIFPVASFIWQASDPDGDSTIAYFEYSLDDTVNWRQTAGTNRQITLNADSGLTVGDHAFYLRAVDIAGARSPIIRLPENPARFWHVKPARGRYLLIDDYLVETGTSGRPDQFYRNLLSTLLSETGDEFSYWNIEELFPASRSQFIETMKLFERVLWYTDVVKEDDEHFITAQVAIPEFRATGGKIIYTVQFNKSFGAQGNPLDFSPVDALGTYYNVITTNSIYYADSAFAQAFPTLPALPQELKVSYFILGLFALTPKATSVPMYRYDAPNTTDDPIFIMVGRNDNTGEYDFVFSGTPLHFLNGNNNLDQFFRVVFQDLFGP